MTTCCLLNPSSSQGPEAPHQFLGDPREELLHSGVLLFSCRWGQEERSSWTLRRPAAGASAASQGRTRVTQRSQQLSPRGGTPRELLMRSTGFTLDSGTPFTNSDLQQSSLVTSGTRQLFSEASFNTPETSKRSGNATPGRILPCFRN